MRVAGGGWLFEALFSNSRRANELGRTRAWVIVRYRRGEQAGQCTIVSARKGTLRDLRVVKGREPECRRYYEKRNVA